MRRCRSSWYLHSCLTHFCSVCRSCETQKRGCRSIHGGHSWHGRCLPCILTLCPSLRVQVITYISSIWSAILQLLYCSTLTPCDTGTPLKRFALIAPDILLIYYYVLQMSRWMLSWCFQQGFACAHSGNQSAMSECITKDEGTPHSKGWLDSSWLQVRSPPLLSAFPVSGALAFALSICKHLGEKKLPQTSPQEFYRLYEYGQTSLRISRSGPWSSSMQRLWVTLPPFQVASAGCSGRMACAKSSEFTALQAKCSLYCTCSSLSCCFRVHVQQLYKDMRIASSVLPHSLMFYFLADDLHFWCNLIWKLGNI